MGKILDFKTRYENQILSIDPGFSPQNGLGYAVLNMDAHIFGGIKNKPILSRCGIVTPFCTDSRLITKEEICNKLVEVWRHHAGFSREPLVLAIEKPIIFPNSPVRASDITNLAELVGMLCRSFQAQRKFTPLVQEWKGRKPKCETKAYVDAILDYNSKQALERDLSSIALGKRHNVFDAIGLGIFIGQVMTKAKPMPRDFYVSKKYY